MYAPRTSEFLLSKRTIVQDKTLNMWQCVVQLRYLLGDGLLELGQLALQPLLLLVLGGLALLLLDLELLQNRLLLLQRPLGLGVLLR